MYKIMTNELLNTPKNVRRKFAKHFLNSVHSEIAFSGTAVNTILSKEEPLKAFFQKEGFETSKRFLSRVLK